MRKFLVSSLIFFFTFLFVFVPPIAAKVITTEKGVVTVTKSDVVNDDLFVAAEVVQIDGTVNGDVFAGAETVNVDGVINGNLHVGASTLNLSGTVTGNIYVGAGTVNVNGLEAGGSIIAGTGTFGIDESSEVGGSLIVGAGNVSLDTTVGRNVMIGAGSATIGSNTKIAKDLYYAVGDEDQTLSIPQSATIGGTIYKSDTGVRKSDMERSQRQFDGAMKSARIFAMIGSFLSALLIGYLYLRFFEGHFTGTAKLVSEQFGKSLGIGFLVAMAFVPALIVLAITIIGLPLAGLLLLILLINFYLVKLVVGLALGRWISNKFNWNKLSTFTMFALGLGVVYLLKLIPVVNIFAGMAISFSGLGALAMMFTSAGKK